MKKGWWWFALVAVAGIGAAWFALVYRDPLFRIKPVREHLLDTLPVTGTARFRDEAPGEEGALCGQVTNVNGGRRIGDGPGAGSRAGSGPTADAGQRLVALDPARWRRFIVVPSVPAFYVEGLAPWGLSLDGRKIAIDAADLEQERLGFVEQYDAAAGIDGIDANRTAEEIAIKTLDEHFEGRWSQYCPTHP
ncbi:hypothetical protein OVY01_10210 [Robbsia sp. Bb-Pol-6]|uniref:DUF4230 domain-containing protein n=1 Tax=Robbsia betulipollinis TaxID=2981849 RepID=A0ABT3ZM21_9BURK|nr:hypothetical protein [Robbsia betulipollinis]MCY0387599.1 hypothetical protein [Robbsia betulipollinis]